jgi:surface carbohydrate biosynthesis protein
MTSPKRARSPRVALVVDHPQRDLGGLVLTATELCQRGVVCHLVPHTLEDSEIWALAPDFVLLNFTRPSNAAFAMDLDRAGIGFGALDTEGGVWEDENAYSQLLWTDAPQRARAAFLCMWGPRLAEHVIQRGFYTADQVRVTGCPRFDFYHADLRPVVQPLQPPGESKPILVNTLYHTVNSRLVSPAQNRAQLTNQYRLSPDKVDAYMAAEAAAIDAMCGIVRSLSADYPGTGIVLRPHPFENPDLYRRNLAGLANVRVDGEGPVHAQIFGSAVLIQRSCTTAIEATLAGVPTLSPQWVPAPSVNPMAESVSLPCADYADLKAKVGAVLGDPRAGRRLRSPAAQEVIEEWFSHPDGRAFRRVGDAVMAALEKQGPTRHVDEEQCRRRLYGIGDRRSSAVQRVGGWLRMRLGLSSSWSFRKMRSLPRNLKEAKRFTASEVRGWVDRILEVRRANGEALRDVAVTGEQSASAYRFAHAGRAVTLWVEAGS